MKIVVKIGGSLLDNEETVAGVVRDVVRLAERNRLIFVHGGGREVNRVAERLGIKQRWVGKPRPWRVTDKATMELMRNVIAGGVNAHLCYLVGKFGGKAIGVNGNESSAIVARKQEYTEWEEGGETKKEWIGFTGLTKKVNKELFNFLLKNKFIPVVACIAQGEEDECLNVNGDELAGVLAAQLRCDWLVLLTDVPGFLADEGDERSVVKKMSVREIQRLLAEKKVHGGMVAKLEACVDAWKAGARRIVLADGRTARPVENALKGGGTMVVA
ncbi:MAG: acetylglutamate kinase [Candidatus Micrarchaeia archaeon]